VHKKSFPIILISIFLFFGNNLYSQLNNEFIFSFDQINSFDQQNFPVIRDTTTDLTFSFKSKTYLGIYRGIRTDYFSISKLFSSPKWKYQIGFNGNQRNLGEYIHRGIYQVNFSGLKEISSNTFLSIGLNLGLNQTKIDQTDAGVGFSSIKPDLNYGLGILNKKYQFFFSTKNFLQSKYKDLNLYSRTKTVYITEFVHIKELNYQVYLETFLFSFLGNSKENYWQILPLFHYNKKCHFGLGYGSKRGFSVLLGLENFDIKDYSLNLSSSYIFLQTKKTQFTNQVVELNLKVARLRIK
jgi:hypothetical protein